jgi:hypothetical protein
VKLWHLPTSVHGAETQNSIIFLTAVKTSNLINEMLPYELKKKKENIHCFRAENGVAQVI